MASSTVFTSAPLFLSLIFISTISSEAKDFLVGGTTNAWKIPTSKTDSLNSWAQGTRFQIGDSLVWKYEAKKDSVVEVTREAYLSCNATDPISQNDEGNTTVRFERSGAFYFISGEKGHCQKGQKLIVVVLSRRSGGSASSSSPSPAPMGSFDGPAIAPASGDAHRIGGSSHVVGALVVLGGLVGMDSNSRAPLRGIHNFKDKDIFVFFISSHHRILVWMGSAAQCPTGMSVPAVHVKSRVSPLKHGFFGVPWRRKLDPDEFRPNATLASSASSMREKKPFPTPILELRRAARERQKSAKGRPKKPVQPPRNGMLVRSLIPVSYEVLNVRTALINNLKSLMKVVTVHACKACNEIHVGLEGHPFKSCRGLRAEVRKGMHDWTRALVDDVQVPVEAFHLADRLGKRIPHEQRFSIPRVPAVVELCIQAGVDLPDLPTKRRRKPVIRLGRSEFIDADEDDLPDPEPSEPPPTLISEIPDSETSPPPDRESTIALAESTLEEWEKLRRGLQRLMKKYAVRVCGYCPEVHIGVSGHKAQNCGAFKHQQRNGQHGWQAAVLDDLIPPRYVWHVPDLAGGPMWRELRAFYGQAPAVVEMCVQGGAEAPEQYRSTMRLDVGIPSNVWEAEMVV
ncbi:hypothetical protein QJS10_CPA05g02213 [Acorus calamus]|uniref:Phytocyanin domain-containing protein n=1 Tax=Acorus calamus TaxID=4465 RepID=A0AAV9ERU0_ACOCL|nr:hypothetical protein QJS10_CPA05g02213 [Acorus calamus]